MTTQTATLLAPPVPAPCDVLAALGLQWRKYRRLFVSDEDMALMGFDACYDAAVDACGRPCHCVPRPGGHGFFPLPGAPVTGAVA